MKRSRTRTALLVLLFLICGFVGLITIVSLFADDDDTDSGVSGLFGSGNRIGVVTIEGGILSADETLKQMEKFYRKSSVKAIVIRIDSPGGTVAPAQEIYRQIGKIKKKKPVVVSMQTVAASAAYLIASNASRIVCSEGTITGSIGVIMMLPDFHKIINKVGVDVNVITSGKFKDMGSSIRPLRADEREYLENFTKEVHRQFVDAVARGRKGKIDREKLDSVADGRFFTGKRAKELGLVDTFGNFFDAVRIAAKLAKIKGRPKLVYPKKKWGGWTEVLMESGAKAFTKALENASMRPFRPVVQ